MSARKAVKAPIAWSETLVVTLKRGLAGKRADQRATVEALGLRGREDSVTKPNNASVRGMLDKVKRLVAVETVEMHRERQRKAEQRKAPRPSLVFKHPPAEPQP